MSIWITGDCHGDVRKLSIESFPEQKSMTKDDYVIICGDFGLVWNKDGETKNEKYWLDWLDSKPFTTLFVDGNHENFDRLYKYPVEEWHGGLIHKIRPSVIHLMRGEIFEICGKKIFSFGGASCHDIQGGILELDDPDFKKKRKELDKEWIPYRINHLSWWEDELPSDEEMKYGMDNLAKHGNEVDFVISHCLPQNVASVISHGIYRHDILTAYFDRLLENKLKFIGWYCGHYHCERNVMGKFHILYDFITQIA